MSNERCLSGDKECGYDILVTYRKPANFDSWESPEITEYRALSYALYKDALYIKGKKGYVYVAVNSDVQTIEISEKEISDE